jgi:hypothetical protein
LIDSVKRVACSKYSDAFARFLEQTRGDDERRLSYDLTEVFRTYINGVGAAGYGPTVEQMHRAVAIMQKLRDMLLAGRGERVVVAPIVSTVCAASPCIRKARPAATEAPQKALPPEAGRLGDVADTLESLHGRIALLGQTRLWVVR